MEASSVLVCQLMDVHWYFTSRQVTEWPGHEGRQWRLRRRVHMDPY